METPQFNFGRNWQAFSERALTEDRVAQARRDFDDLLGEIEIRGRSFLDIGFGQGLTLLLAASRGARVVGCDINPLCAEVLSQNLNKFFPELTGRSLPIVLGSILDENVIKQLRANAPDQTEGAYDIVHSWGVLHHTGDMKRALEIAGSLVRPGGYLIVAIYARHWSSGIWQRIKRFYNQSSPAWQAALVRAFYPLIYAAKWLVTRQNPRQQNRGMDFYHDVVDWVGGYPYEYATPDEVKEAMKSNGFECPRIIPATVPTGCNQFVFRLNEKASNRAPV